MLLGALPFKEDFDEAEAVYGSLCSLLHNGKTAARLQAHVPDIIRVRHASSAVKWVPLEIGHYCIYHIIRCFHVPQSDQVRIQLIWVLCRPESGNSRKNVAVLLNGILWLLMQALGAVLMQQDVAENVRKQVAFSLVQLQHQAGNNNQSIATLLHALPPEQRAALSSHAA